MEVGTVCIKLRGREAGKTCVVVDNIDENFVLIESPSLRRRRCNLRHLKLTGTKLNIKKGATKKAVEKALKRAKISF